MKKPDETKRPTKPKTPRNRTSPETAKTAAAAPGTLASSDIGAGSGKTVEASGVGTKRIESSLVGDKDAGRPAAAPKSQASPEPAKPATSTPEPVKTAEPVRPTPAQPTPVTKVDDRAKVERVGFWPVVLGGVVAAGLGAGVTLWALPHLPASWLPETPAAAPQIDTDAIRADAVSAAQSAAQQQIDALRSELVATTPAAAPDGADAEAVAQMQQRLEQQAQQIDQLNARAQIDPAMAERLETLAAQAEALETQIQSAAQQAQSQISEAQAEAQKLQEAAEGSTRRAEAVAAVASLQAALDRGVMPDEARQTLEGAGLDAPEALTREIASLDSLQTGFGEAARAALRTTLREESAAGQGNLITNFLRAQTGARSVEPREGDDPDAILSRANAEVEAGRIGAALDQMAALPDTAKAAPAMAEWLDKATAYRDAQAALSDLSANSN